MKLRYFMVVLSLVIGFQNAVHCNDDQAFDFGDIEQLQAIDYELSSRLRDSRDSLWRHLFKACVLSGVVHTVGMTSFEDLKNVFTEGRWARMAWLVACGAVGIHEFVGMYEDLQEIIEFASYRSAIEDQINGFEHARLLMDDMDEFDFSVEDSE